MSNEIIRAAFETRLDAWAATHSLPVAHQNEGFTPPEGAYVRCWLLPAPTRSYGLEGVHRKYSGVFQVDLCMPPDAGPNDATELAKSLDAIFPMTAPMTQSGLHVWITDPVSEGPGKQEQNHYVVPVSCGYRADTI